jgi:hypothetical protein
VGKRVVMMGELAGLNQFRIDDNNELGIEKVLYLIQFHQYNQGRDNRSKLRKSMILYQTV